jgi:hypothetical protein
MRMIRLRDFAAALVVTALIYGFFVLICALDDGCAGIYMAPI